MSRWLKALPVALALAALIVLAAFAASCGSSGAQARFVNAVSGTGAGPLDIDFDGIKVFSSVGLDTASGSTYAGIPAGNVTIEGFQPNSTTPAFPSQVVSLNAGSQYTLVAAGPLTGTVNILHPVDVNAEPANANVTFRVINASSRGPSGSGGAVDVFIIANPNPVLPTTCSGATCVSNVAYQGTGSTTIPYNSEGSGWQIFVLPHGGGNQYFNATFPGNGGSNFGSICTIVLYDQSSGAEMAQAFIPLNDLNCPTL